MKNTTMTLNDCIFTVHAKTTVEKPQFTPWDYADIMTAYTNPSQYKRNIWKAWQLWAREIGASIWISSRTAHFFTIEGFITIDGIDYALRITAWNADLYRIA